MRDDDDNDKRKTWLGSQLDEDALNAVWRAAGEVGLHPTDFAKQLIDEGLVAYAKRKEELGETVHASIVIRRLQIESRERRSRLALCKQLAYELEEDRQNEEISDAFIMACKLAGVEPNEISSEVSGLSHVQELMKEQGTLNQAELWLAENMEPGQRYSMKKLVASAGLAGISETRLKRAKVAIGAKSVRVASQWAWCLPAPDLDNATEDDEDGRIPIKGF